MRIFLMWGSGYPQAKDLIIELSKSHKIVYVVGELNDGVDNFSEIIFHDYFDAYEGRPPENSDVLKFDPPGEILIQKLRDAESLILTMMNKRYDWMCVDERRHLYFDMLKYWHGVVDQYKPDVIIFRTVPHGIFDYLVYELARMSNIKTVMFWNSFIPERLFMYNDFRKGDVSLRQSIEKNKDKNFSLGDLSSITRAYYERQTKKGFDATPIYTKEDRKNSALLNILRLKSRMMVRSILDMSIFEKAVFYFLKLFKQNIKDEYESLQSEVDFNKPFVYLPLHFQPELTSCPLGEMFSDQILMIETVSASLPDGWFLYVKEHPSQWPPRGLNFFSSRYRGYYKKIARLENVRIIPLYTDTYDLINAAKAVATISGVPGLEARMRLKPVIIFGYPWYRDFPGVFKVSDVTSCREALQKIKDGFKPTTQGTINFLKSVDEAAIYGYIDRFGKADSEISEQENLNTIIETINARGIK